MTAQSSALSEKDTCIIANPKTVGCLFCAVVMCSFLNHKEMIFVLATTVISTRNSQTCTSQPKTNKKSMNNK